MWEAGVSFTFVERVVTTYYPSRSDESWVQWARTVAEGEANKTA